LASCWRFLVYAVLAVSLSTTSASAAGSATKVTVETQHSTALFRMAALNAEWLWTPNDGHVDGARFNRGDPSIEDYNARLAYFAGVIRTHEVDVLAISEIENERVAEEFSRALGADWSYVFRQGRDTATGQDVALLTRIGEFTQATDFGFPAGSLKGYKPKRLSKLLGARLRIEPTYALTNTITKSANHTKTVAIVTSHFLSKRNESNKKAAKRLMQAKALVSAAQQFSDYDALVIAGDLNDFTNSPVLNELRHSLSLHNAQSSCAVSQAHKNVRYFVDHILYKGLKCKVYISESLSPYSDHPIVIAEFVL